MANSKQNSPEQPGLDALAAPSVYVPEASHVHVPDEVKAWAEASFAHWQRHPDEWRQVILPHAEAAEKIIEQARAYLKTRETPLTLQLRGKIEHLDDGTVRLVHRVRDKVASGRKPGK